MLNQIMPILITFSILDLQISQAKVILYINPIGSSFGSLMDSIKIMEDNNSFYEKQYYKNLQKNNYKKETLLTNNFLMKSKEKKSHVDKFSELFSNLYPPENSSRMPGR